MSCALLFWSAPDPRAHDKPTDHDTPWPSPTCLEASKSTGKSEPNVQVTAWPSAELGGMADGLKSPGKPSVLKT